MSEIQRLNEQGAKKKLETQTLTPEQQKRFEKEKQEIIMLSQAQRNSLSSEAVSSYLKNHHNIDLSKYSSEIKEKFIQEIQMLFSEFKNFDTSMIPRLRAIREGMSFGLEDGKTDEYYRNMIIGNAIETRITILKATIETQYGETIDFKGTKVNKTDFENYKTNIKNLDTQNGLNIFDAITSKLRPSITGGLNFRTLNLQEIIQQECKKNNKPYSERLFQEYNKHYQEFVGKNMVFQAKNGNGVIKYQGKGFGLQNGGPTGLDNDRLKDIYKDKMQDINIENMGMADLVIMMRVLFGVIPVAGDMVGGYDDGKQALAGVNFDGSMHGLGENAFMYLISGLQLSFVGGTFAKLAKGPKLAKVIATLGRVINKLSKAPEMLRVIGKNKKVMNMLEAMKGAVPGVEKLLESLKLIDHEGGRYKFLDTKDLSKYFHKLKGVEALPYKEYQQQKFAMVYRIPDGKEIPVTTKMANGLSETENIARSGDYLILQPNGEIQVIRKENYTQYTQVGTNNTLATESVNKSIKKMSPEQQSIYNSVLESLQGVPGQVVQSNGELRRVFQVDSDVAVLAPWGETQYIKKGGYVVQRPNGEIYGIQKAEFENTHTNLSLLKSEFLSSIKSEIPRLIANDYLYNKVLNQETANYLIRNMEIGPYVIMNIEKFSGVNHLEIALNAIDYGDTNMWAIAKNIDKFDSMYHNEIALKLMQKNPYPVLSYIDDFKGLDYLKLLDTLLTPHIRELGGIHILYKKMNSADKIKAETKLKELGLGKYINPQSNIWSR